jgi:hypothetical protein
LSQVDLNSVRVIRFILPEVESTLFTRISPSIVERIH